MYFFFDKYTQGLEEGLASHMQQRLILQGPKTQKLWGENCKFGNCVLFLLNALSP